MSEVLRVSAKDPVKPAGDKSDWVKIVLADSDDIPPTGLPVGDNGVLYILQPGVEALVPPGVVEILSNAVVLMPVQDKDTLQIVNTRPRQMYPFSRV